MTHTAGCAVVAAAAAIIIGAGTAGAQSKAATPPEVTPAAVALGENIFKGKAAGGLCFTCHQLNAKGLPGLAPDLTDDKWLHGDGSYAFIVSTVEKGVPKPKQSAAPMLPKGGSNLTPAQVKAVAAYVYSLRKK
jgi:mono/diheme cytochrome c family protein